MGNYDVSPPRRRRRWTGHCAERQTAIRSDGLPSKSSVTWSPIPREAVGTPAAQVHDHAAKPIVVADPDLGRLGQAETGQAEPGLAGLAQASPWGAAPPCLAACLACAGHGWLANVACGPTCADGPGSARA